MTILTLQVQDNMLEKVLGLLSQFKHSEVEVLAQNADMEAQREYLKGQMAQYRKGELKTVTVQELERHMATVAQEYEH